MGLPADWYGGFLGGKPGEGGTVATAAAPAASPPVLFVHMPRDEHTAQLVAKDIELRKSKVCADQQWPGAHDPPCHHAGSCSHNLACLAGARVRRHISSVSLGKQGDERPTGAGRAKPMQSANEVGRAWQATCAYSAADQAVPSAAVALPINLTECVCYAVTPPSSNWEFLLAVDCSLYPLCLLCLCAAAGRAWSATRSR